MVESIAPNDPPINQAPLNKPVADDYSAHPDNYRETPEKKKEKEKRHLTLSDISPDLRKVETFFISSIKVELAKINASEEEQEMVVAYLQKVKELGAEYENLNEELNTIGVNDMTIMAMIENLKIRLQLLQRLQKKLNHSKKDTHEKSSSNSI